jgi:hypothetical protein
MNSADARTFIEAEGLGDRVEKINADAPPLSEIQMDTLRSILNTTNGGPDKSAAVIADHSGGSRRVDRS